MERKEHVDNNLWNDAVKELNLDRIYRIYRIKKRMG